MITTCILSVRIAAGQRSIDESLENDAQWSRVVDMKLVPHPDQPDPALAVLDYPMQEGILHVQARAALAGYMLRRWSIDCSKNHVLRGPEYRLWLSNREVLEGIDSATIAPGFLNEDSTRG